jgi:hypothetical protein
MEKLISNAQSQFNKNGKIVVSIYPDGIYQNEYQLTCESFEDAIELIKNSFFSLHDDIHISHSNAL